MRSVRVVVAESVYILFASVRGSVNAVHRSRVGWCRGVGGIRRSVFLGDVRYVGWGRSIIYRYVSIFSRSIVVKVKFQVGLVVGVR